MTQIPVSVLILTRNEAGVIERTLESVRDFAEVVVIDSASTDETESIARAMGARVVQFLWNHEYPKKKEWALGLDLRHDWVLYLDADEYVTSDLAEEIRRAVSAEKYDAYDIAIDYYFLRTKLKHGHRVRKRVLLNRSSTRWPRPNDLGATNMWEVEGHYQPYVVGSVGMLSNHLAHDDTDGLYEYFSRHNRYSDWEAYVAINRDVSAYRSRNPLSRLVRIVPAKPIAFFIYSYLVRLGFLDGYAGFHYALAHVFYHWQIGLKRRELKIKARVADEFESPSASRA